MTRSAASLSERLADDIAGIIREQRLGPGDVIASSRELARRFAVTTPTVREALRRLEAIGVVEFRHGSGTYVGPGVDRRLMANPHRPGPDRQSVLELIEARLVLEPPIAAAAARTRDPHGLAQLEVALDNARQPPDGAQRPAVLFHVALAATTGNGLLAETVDALLQVRSAERLEIRLRYDDRDRDYDDHARILSAVRAGDAELAQRLTTEHLHAIRAAVRA